MPGSPRRDEIVAAIARQNGTPNNAHLTTKGTRAESAFDMHYDCVMIASRGNDREGQTNICAPSLRAAPRGERRVFRGEKGRGSCRILDATIHRA
jgi:hypothetical protein